MFTVYILNCSDRNTERTIGIFKSHNFASAVMDRLISEDEKYYGRFDISEKRVSAELEEYYCTIRSSSSMGANVRRILGIYSDKDSLPAESRTSKFSCIKRTMYVVNEVYDICEPIKLI